MMKKLFIPLALVIFVLVLNSNLFSQVKLKIGYIDSNELLMLLPERDSAKVTLEQHVKALQNQLMAMSNEFDSKYQDFLANESKFSELIKQTKSKELQDLKTRIEEYQKSAQEELENKEAELLNPIIAKAKKAIEDVAKENAYTYVLDLSSGAVLFYEGGDNILPLVKKKLGL